MRKRIVSFLVLLLLGFAGLAAATYVGDLLRAGIDVTGSGIVFNYDSLELEGTTKDAYETSIAVTDPTADRTITIPDSNQTLGTATTVGDDPTLGGSIAYNTTTVTVAGPTDDLDISGVNVVFIDTSGADVTLGGTTGGVSGQVVQVVIVDATGNATVEHTEGVNQDFYLVDGSDQTITTSYGGWTFVCNGTNLYEVDHD